MALQNITLYCTESDVQRRLSIDGEQALLDMNNDGMVDATEQQGLTDAITDATETINFYLFSKYDPVWLVQSNWVNRRTVDLAIYALCGFRNHTPPDHVVDRAQKAEEDLEAIADGPRKVPGLPQRLDTAPIISNVRVDPRFTWKKIRVERPISSKPSTGYAQVPDYQADLFWEI